MREATKPFVIRGIRTGLLIVASFLSWICIAFSVIGLYALTIEDTPTVVLLFSGILLVIILGFGIIWFCTELFAYCSKVIIDHEKISWVRPFRKRRTFPIEQLSFWGCVSYAPRSTMMFFCAENTEYLAAYLQTHQEECQRIFGTNRSEALKNSDTGKKQLAVGTYIRLHFSGTDTLFLLRYGDTKRMKELVNVLRRDAMITGPWLLDTASDWEKTARYVPE